MDPHTIILVISAYFIASFLKGLTGLGFSTLCLGLLAAFMDLKFAIPLVFLPSLASNIMIMMDAGRFFEAIKRFWLLYLSALPGLALGIWFLDASANAVPKTILGSVMLFYGIWGLKSGLMQLSGKKEKRLVLPVGLVTGLINGMTGSQVMPIMPFLLSLKINRDLFVQAINCSFTINTLFMIIGFSRLGLVTGPVVYLSAAGILPVALGVFLGGQIRRRVTDDLYRKMVLALLIALGVNLIFRSFI